MSTILLILSFSHIHTAGWACEECQGLHSRAGLQHDTREHSLPSAHKAGEGASEHGGCAFFMSFFFTEMQQLKGKIRNVLAAPLHVQEGSFESQCLEAT